MKIAGTFSPTQWKLQTNANEQQKNNTQIKLNFQPFIVQDLNIYLGGKKKQDASKQRIDWLDNNNIRYPQITLNYIWLIDK